MRTVVNLPRHHVLYRAERRSDRPESFLQIGIRTEFDKDNGFTVLDAAR